MTNKGSTKAEIMQALLKSPTTSEVMRKALSAPIGSTDRIRARKVLSVLNRGARIPDGAGGPSYTPNNGLPTMGMPETLQTGVQSAPASPAMIFHAMPTNLPAAPVLNMATPEPVQSPTPTPVTPVTAAGATPAGLHTSTQTFEPIRPLTPAPVAATMPQATPAVFPTKEVPAAPTTTKTEPKFTTTPVNIAAKAGNASTGAGFVMDSLNDVATVRQLLGGAPGIPDDQLPVGGNLTQQVSKMSETLKEQYGLTKMQEDIDAKRAAGVTVKDDLVNYVRGRDTYLSKVDSMIKSFEAETATRDMSDPNTRKSANNYLNYLYTVHGRTNQRYMDYVNTSINQYNKEMEQMQSKYSTAVEQYKTEFELKAAATQEDYNNMKSVLTEVYNEVKNAPAKAIEMELLRLNLQNARREASASAIGYTNSDIYKDTESTYDLLTQNDILFKGNKNDNTGRQPVVVNPKATPENILNVAQTDPAKTVDVYARTLANNFQNGDFINSKDAESAFSTSINVFRELTASGAGDLRPRAQVVARPYADSITSRIMEADSTGDSAKTAFLKIANRGLWGDFRGKRAEPITEKKFVEQASSVFPETVARYVYDQYRQSDYKTPQEMWSAWGDSNVDVVNKISRDMVTGQINSVLDPANI